MPQPVQTLESLPAEVLTRICECLYHDDYVASLVAFASANKLCHSYASGILARTIKFAIDYYSEYPGHLSQDIEICRNVLRRDGNLGQVRRLVVQGEPPSPSASGWGVKPTNPGQRHKSIRPRITPAERTDDETRLGGYVGEGRQAEGGEFIQELEMARHVVADSYWQPLADLIKDLSGLTDLLYACPSQLSPCVLEALHQYRPRCRLHIRNFNLRSIFEETLNAHELKLATSPCLYSIRCAYIQAVALQDMESDDDELNPNDAQNAAAMRLVTRLAPALGEVSLRFPFGQWAGPLPEKPWKALDTSKLPLSSASLRVIEMNAYEHLTVEYLDGWAGCNDFSVLRVLKIPSRLDIHGMQLLASWSLPSLINLTIALAGGETEEYYETATRILSGLSSQLVTLRICSWSPSVPLSSILGPNLRTLDLRKRESWPLRLNDVLEISTRCPLIEDLSVRLNRSQGDAAEVAAYRTLGKLPRLRKLRLDLAARLPKLPRQMILELREGSNLENSPLWERDDAASDDEEKEEDDDEDELGGQDEETALIMGYRPYTPFKRRHFRKLFIDMALDDNLAQAIFQVIASARGSSQHAALETLEVRVIGADHFRARRYLQLKLDQYVGEMCRKWTIKRNPRDDRRSELFVQKRKELMEEMRFTYPLPVEQSPLHVIFRGLWPHDGDEMVHSWRKDWRSFPLCVDE